MPKKFKSRKRNKKYSRSSKKLKKITDDDLPPDEFPPRSFIIHQGNVGSRLQELVGDFKRVMMPNTADKLRARKSNKIADFVSMAGPYKVTHLVIFNLSEHGPNLKLCRLPQGPTLTFRIDQYSLASEVLSTLKAQMTYSTQFQTAPCLMTNIQPDEGENHLRLCAQMILDMYPNINPTKVRLRDIRRCCLFNYDPDKEEFDFRHYAIRTRPVGLSKAVKKLAGTKIPNLQDFADISDYVLKSEMLSESEAEEDSKLDLNLSTCRSTKGKFRSTKSSVKLTEIGPRLGLKLLKIEEGLCTGTVLYHRFHSKAPEEVLEIEKKREEAAKLKEARRKQQMENVKRKLEEKERHKQKCLQGMRKRMAPLEEDQENDDAQYYREEVGEEPDRDLFHKGSKRKSQKR